MALLSIALVFGVSVALGLATDFSFLDLAFEAVSAFGTVGLSTGITPELSDGAHLLLVLTMFAGRLGPRTLVLALASRARPLPTVRPRHRPSTAADAPEPSGSAVARRDDAGRPEVARDNEPGGEGLTEREHELVEHAVDGRSNVEMATAMGLGTRTVEAHLTRLYERYGVQSRASWRSGRSGGLAGACLPRSEKAGRNRPAHVEQGGLDCRARVGPRRHR